MYSQKKKYWQNMLIKPRPSCVAWLTGPRSRLVNMQRSVDNSMKAQNSLPYINHQINLFSAYFPVCKKNCRDSKRMNALPMSGLKLRQLVAFPHNSHLMHFWDQRTLEVKIEWFWIRRQIKVHLSAKLWLPMANNELNMKTIVKRRLCEAWGWTYLHAFKC